MWKPIVVTSCAIAVTSPAFGSDPNANTQNPTEPVSKTQFIADQRAIFDNADENFDGTLSKSELQAVKTFFERQDKLQAFKSLDTDSSGYLTKAELMAGHDKDKNYPVQQADRLKKSFLDVRDLDRNGTISAYEISKYYEDYAETLSQKITEHREQMFYKLDADDTGAVTEEEFLVPLDDFTTDETVMKFITRDQNSDGIIERSENLEFIKSVFSVLDVDSNNELSLPEQSIYLYQGVQRIEAEKYFIGKDSWILERIETN